MRKLFVALLFICVVLILASFYLNGYRRTWRQIWNLQTYSSPFLDMRVITGSAESLAAGYDPYINNPYDPLHRLFNYPLIWHVVLKSGINLHWTNPLAVICIALFFLGLALFPGKLTYPAIILLLLITFSPAVMLGVERGNVDLVFFFLISIALILVEISNLAALLLLLLGVLFKLYPVFSLGLFLDVKKKDYLKYI